MWKNELGDDEEPTRVAGAPTTLLDENAVTGVVIDMELEEKLREILRHDLFMRARDVDAIFELARNWEWGKPKPKMQWPEERGNLKMLPR